MSGGQAEISPGRAAYEAYKIAKDGRSLISGALLPGWDDLVPEISEAWRAAADAAVMFASLRPSATGALPGDSPTWEDLAGSLTRERDALFAETRELRRKLEDATSATVLRVKAEDDAETPAYWQVRAALTSTHSALALVAVSRPGEHGEVAAMARRTLIEADAILAQEPERPRIVCLCGSTRFGDAFARASLERTLAGEIVLSIGCNMRDDEVFAGKDQAELARIKGELDDLHKRKIDLADYVLVVSDGSGYFGDSTASEIEYAVQHRKPVTFTVEASRERAMDLGLWPMPETPS